MYHPFSIAETIKTAWDIFKKNFVTIVVYSIVSFFLVFISGLLVDLLIPPSEFYVRFASLLIVVFIQAYTTLGLYKLIFTLIDSEYYEFEIKQILPHISMIFSYLTVIFIVGFCIATYKIFILNKLTQDSISYKIADYIGVAFGLYITIRIMFFNSFVVDDKSGPLESLKQSFQLTKDYISKVVLILIIVLLLISLLILTYLVYPVLAICLFFVFVYPFVNIVLIEMYRKLVYSHKDVDDDVAETL